jgi:hypothetical protein
VEIPTEAPPVEIPTKAPPAEIPTEPPPEEIQTEAPPDGSVTFPPAEEVTTPGPAKPVNPTWPPTTGAPEKPTEEPEELTTSLPDEVVTTPPEPPLEECPGVHIPKPDHQECPGKIAQARVDRDTCFAIGIDIVVDEDHTHVEDFFYDNVGMKGDANWRQLGGGGEEFEYELRDPRTKRFRAIHENLTDHRFAVGVSIVEVIGYDYAGNQHSCFRTVIVCDTPDEFCGKTAPAVPAAVSRPEHATQHEATTGLMYLSHERDLGQLVQNARAHVHAHEPLPVQPASRSPKTLLSFRRAHKTTWVDTR